VKKKIISFFATIVLSTCSFSLAKADTGKIIPDEFLWLLVIGFVSLLILVVLFISTIIKLLYRKNNKKEPKKLILIILLTILLPIIWLYAEANYHLLYNIETKYDYRIKEIFNNGIAIVLAMLGMGLGFIIKNLFK
jgi:nitrogen fixation/metabolism regulation signal transduction histidine kinase